MKKIFISLSLLLVFLTVSISAQTTNQNVNIKPEFIVADVVFAYSVLNTIDINGREVEPFLACKNHLKTLVEKAQTEKKQAGDKITDDMPLSIAQNLAVFLERGTFKGEQAEMYQRFIKSLVDAVNKLPKK